MTPEFLQLLIDAAPIAATAVAALIGVKMGLNGLKRDSHNTACDIKEIKVSLKDASSQRGDLDRRLAFVEGEIGQIGQTLNRMEGS